MDFKVAGTKDGITALQMDIKCKGITFEILKEALAQAKKGRMQILEHMMSTISEVRPTVSKYAPKVKMIKIDTEKIREVIGSGGKNIQEIIEKCNQVKIDIEQDGRVFVMHAELEWIDKAIELIENICREPELNAIYPAKVIKVLEIGAVVEIWPGCEGLVHISNLAWRRVAKVEDEVKEGDEIVVKLIEIGQNGKLRFSRKDTLPKPENFGEDRKNRKKQQPKEEKVESESKNDEE